MTTRAIEFLFDVGSPTSYLAWTQLPALAARTGATVTLVPILLGGVFKATGNLSPAAVPAKGRYMGEDMARFAARYGVPLTMNPFFPINTLALMRAASAERLAGRLGAYLDAVFPALWVEGRNLGDADELAAVLARAGIDAGDLMARASGDAAKDALKTATEQAIARGVFGAPTFLVGDAMFFGQDRLDFVAEAATAP